MPNPDRTWAGAAVVAVLGGVAAGVGGLLAILGFNGPLALVYALVALVALTAVVARAAPPDERDEDFWLKVGGLVAVGLLASCGAGFLGFLILWNSAAT
jgi:hypothetical protein